MSGAALAHASGEYAPWLQLDDETAPAYHGFEHYRDMGHERSYEAAYNEHAVSCMGQDAGKVRATPGRWTLWSSKNGWLERATAWDRELTGSKLDGVRLQAVEMGKRQAEQAARNLDVLDFPAKLITEILKRSPLLVERIAEMATTPAEEDGSNPPMGVAELMGILKLVKDAASAMPGLAKMEREAMGVQEVMDEEEAGEQVQVTVEVVYPGGRPA